MKRKIYNYLKRALKIIFNSLELILSKKESLIIFESFLGKQYSDNPRAIYEYMVKNNYGYNMYWSIDKRHIADIDLPKDVVVRRFSIKWIYLMTRAKYWVTNSRLPNWFKKSNKTIYIQTWHGTPLKKLALDMDEVHMPGTDTQRYKRNFALEASKWDYLVSPNEYSTSIFKRAFNFQKKLLETGYPRNDYLITSNNKSQIQCIKEKLNLPDNKKIILYAPTWRDNQYYRVGQYKFNLEMDLELMQEKLGTEYVVILRLHYLVAANIDLSSYNGFVYNFSNYEDIRDLYLISDLLITDYSSVFFDYSILKRPIIFFVYDIEEYRDNLRGFYFDLEREAPGDLVKTTEEIIELIENIGFNDKENSNDIISFSKRFNYLEDGNATKRVVEAIFPKGNL